MKYQNILEEELKNKVGHDYFAAYNHTDIIERIDFAVAHPETFFGQKHYFLWAEAKRANSDIYKALAQLILTIGKARTFERLLPPNYLGVFNSQIIAFIPYWEIQDIFSQNDFNWNVTPPNSSKYTTASKTSSTATPTTSDSAPTTKNYTLLSKKTSSSEKQPPTKYKSPKTILLLSIINGYK